MGRCRSGGVVSSLARSPRSSSSPSRPGEQVTVFFSASSTDRS
jgi:hypothetical protein